MRTYRQLFRTPEFRPIFAATCLQSAAATVVGLALATDVYARTGSPFFAAVSMFGPSLAQMAGFAAGSALVTVLSPAGTLLTGAGFHLIASVVIRFGLTRRAARAVGRPSVAATWRVNARLWTIPGIRPVYAGLWIPNGLIV